jgi:Protein of unknown function (DUF5818)
VEVIGSVIEGVEHGSVVLVCEDGATYQLGRGYQHLIGRRVAVRGRARPDVMTTAQQGVVLTVESVDDLGPGARDVTPPGGGASAI